MFLEMESPEVYLVLICFDIYIYIFICVCFWVMKMNKYLDVFCKKSWLIRLDFAIVFLQKFGQSDRYDDDINEHYPCSQLNSRNGNHSSLPLVLAFST